MTNKKENTDKVTTHSSISTKRASQTGWSLETTKFCHLTRVVEDNGQLTKLYSRIHSRQVTTFC